MWLFNLHIWYQLGNMISTPFRASCLCRSTHPSGLEVFGELKLGIEDACRGSRRLKVCGQLVCGRGFMKLLGVGKRRFQKLGKAARMGEEYCPYDARYISRGQKEPGHKWQKVFDYLMDMYNNVAEHIPDGLNSNKRPRQGKFKLDDPNMDRSSIRHLPPGSISEYHKQCQNAVKDESISRKLFCSVPFLT